MSCFYLLIIRVKKVCSKVYLKEPFSDERNCFLKRREVNPNQVRVRVAVQCKTLQFK